MAKEDCNCGGCGHDHDHDHEHDCGCGHDHGEQRVVISLDGETDVECMVIGTFDVANRDYIALQPIGDDEVIIFRFSEEDGNVQLDNIESDEEYEEVAEVFYELFSDEEGLDDEDFDGEGFDDEESDK